MESTILDAIRHSPIGRLKYDGDEMDDGKGILEKVESLSRNLSHIAIDGDGDPGTSRSTAMRTAATAKTTSHRRGTCSLQSDLSSRAGLSRSGPSPSCREKRAPTPPLDEFRAECVKHQRFLLEQKQRIEEEYDRKRDAHRVAGGKRASTTIVNARVKEFKENAVPRAQKTDGKCEAQLQPSRREDMKSAGKRASVNDASEKWTSDAHVDAPPLHVPESTTSPRERASTSNSSRVDFLHDDQASFLTKDFVFDRGDRQSRPIANTTFTIAPIPASSSISDSGKMASSIPVDATILPGKEVHDPVAGEFATPDFTQPPPSAPSRDNRVAKSSSTTTAITELADSLNASCRVLRLQLDGELPVQTMPLHETVALREMLARFESILNRREGIDAKTLTQIADGVKRLQMQVAKRIANGSKPRRPPSPDPAHLGQRRLSGSTASPLTTPSSAALTVSLPDEAPSSRAARDQATTATTTSTRFREQFEDALAYHASFEASLAEFVSPRASKDDLMRRAILKRTMKEKISVMTKRMATRDEMTETVEFLDRLMNGEVVDDHAGNRLTLAAQPIAMRFATAFVIETYLTLVGQDASVIYVVAAVLSSLMRSREEFRRLCIAKLCIASTLLSLDPEKCLSSASRTALEADARAAWMQRETALVRLFVVLHCTGTSQQPGIAIKDGPGMLWRLAAHLLAPPTAPIATAVIFVELVQNAGWLLARVYGVQFAKLVQCARVELVEQLQAELRANRLLERIGCAAPVVALQHVLERGEFVKPEFMV